MSTPSAPCPPPLRALSRFPLGIARQFVIVGEPRDVVRRPYVQCRPEFWVIIQRCYAQEDMRLYCGSHVLGPSNSMLACGSPTPQDYPEWSGLVYEESVSGSPAA